MKDTLFDKYVKPNIIMIIIFLVQSTLFIGYTKWQITSQEERLNKIESLEPQKVLWRVDSQEASIASLQNDQKTNTTSISEIKAQISVINTKLDAILEAVKDHIKESKK